MRTELIVRFDDGLPMPLITRSDDLNDEWSDAGLGSRIALKARSFRPTGGIAAAPTTSPPE